MRLLLYYLDVTKCLLETSCVEPKPNSHILEALWLKGHHMMPDNACM